MRVILLTHGGADIVIDKLAALPNIDLAGVFIETVVTNKRGLAETVRRSIKYDGFAATAGKIFSRSSRNGDPPPQSPDQTERAAARNGVPVIPVENFHSPDSIEKMSSIGPDLGVVYGTNIIKESVFSLPRLGSINLHQGLAPYYRGGPPVFWELFNGESEIGLTVHFVAAKVDTGDIILQRKLPLRFEPAFGLNFETFIENYRSALREPSAELVAEAVERISRNDFNRTPQDATLGTRYRLPTKKEKDEMRRRIKMGLKNKEAM